MLFSEPKIPQSFRHLALSSEIKSFSALQRAENSSITGRTHIDVFIQRFQCSSASRKFLNDRHILLPPSSKPVSVLFSEPKIPQSDIVLADATGRPTFQCSSASRKFLNLSIASRNGLAGGVSVLFSEPKIPQSTAMAIILFGTQRFSALQRAENSSIRTDAPADHAPAQFQCSSASRKFLNSRSRRCIVETSSVSVLFSEPKIPQFGE